MTTQETISKETNVAPLGPKEFAREIGTGENRVRDLCRQGKIRHIRFGRNIKIPHSEITAFVEREAIGGDQ